MGPLGMDQQVTLQSHMVTLPCSSAGSGGGGGGDHQPAPDPSPSTCPRLGPGGHPLVDFPRGTGGLAALRSNSYLF